MTREEAIAILRQEREGICTDIQCTMTMYKDYSGVDKCNQDCEEREAYDMAIEALQREIPKNPIVNYVADSDGARRLNDVYVEDSLLCPVCHAYFGTVYNEGYCYRCGQKLIQKRVRVIEK